MKRESSPGAPRRPRHKSSTETSSRKSCPSFLPLTLVTHAAPITDVCNHSASEQRLLRIGRFLFVAKGHWLERKDNFTRLIHALDLVLEALRRDDRAEVSGRIRISPERKHARAVA